MDNLPKVTPDKVEKLKGVVLKTYAQIATYLTVGDICMPLDATTGATHGFCFIKFLSSEDAWSAVKHTDGGDFSKKPLRVQLYSDLDKYGSVTEQYVPQAPPAFAPRPDPTGWLSDSQGRDQLVLRQGPETQIYWGSAIVGEDPLMEFGPTNYSGDRDKTGTETGNWCDMTVTWSPQGTYLATFHEKGIKLWGGSGFELQGRFQHMGVERMSFSPCERYMVTYRLYEDTFMNSSGDSMLVWDIRSGKMLKAFEVKNALDVKCHAQTTITEEKVVKKTAEEKAADAKKGAAAVVTELKKKIERLVRGKIESYDGKKHTYTIEEGATKHVVLANQVQPLMDPNHLKWSYDGKYLARLGCDIIQIFELPNLALLERRSLPAKDVMDFSWSPASNMVSYYSPTIGNLPAIINIVSIPDRTIVGSRKVFDVVDCKMVWQNDGDYFSACMTKVQNKKRTSVIMVFRMLDPLVPVEQIELSEQILHMSWEPSGDKFVLIQGEPRNSTISLYSMGGLAETKGSGGKGAPKGPQKKELVLLYSIPSKSYSDILWSPAGGVAALFNYVSETCLFELYDFENNQSLAQRKHERGNKLVWDPSGRILASATISPIPKSRQTVRPVADDGFNLYSFQGSVISQMKKDRLYQFEWRPRPKDLLSPEEKKKVIKNLKKYEKKFAEEDLARKQALDSTVMAERRALAEQYLLLMRERKARCSNFKAKRVALRNGYDSDDDRHYEVTKVMEEKIIGRESEVL